jgi:hypothetical protein
VPLLRSQDSRAGDGASRLLAAALTWAALLGVVAPATATDEIAVPADVQAALFVKIATFDRALPALPKKDLAIGILYERRVRASLEIEGDFVRALAAIPGQRIADKPFHTVALDWDGVENIGAMLDREPIQILYVTPLRAVSIEQIAAAAKARGIRTWTGVPDYVERGLALGIGLRGDRPLILINLPQAQAEGCDLSSQLLRVARVIS